MTTLKKIVLCIIFAYSSLSSAETITIAGSGADLATFKILTDKFTQKNPGTKFKILPSIGSGGGIKAVKNNKIDLCLTSRSPKQKELSENLAFNLYAQTPLVFTVNRGLDLKNVTTQNIIDIYSGKMTHWNNNIQIKPILRPSNDSDTLLLTKYIPDFEQAIAKAYKRRGFPVATTDQDTIDLISTLEGAIGSSTMSIIKTTDKYIKAISLNGIEPTSENIKNKSYPLYKNLYLCYNSKTSKSLTDFIQFIASKDGKKILSETGHNTVTTP